MACSCWANRGPESKTFEALISEFYELRTDCPVLRNLLIPDKILEEHRASVSEKPDEANQSSAPFIAFLKNELGYYCAPYHRLINQDNTIHERLSLVYAKELRENWLFQYGHLRRFLQFRRFHSRWCELRLVDWLEEEGWEIEGIEALGATTDIESIDPEGRSVDIEVKYISEAEETRLSVVSAMNSPQSIAFSRGDIYSPVNYLVLRAYDAGKQLAKSKVRKIACFIIFDYNLSFRLPLSDSPPWIDWANPEFFNARGSVLDLINRERRKNSNYDKDLVRYVTAIDEVWIMSFKKEYSLKLEHTFFPKE